MKRVRCNACFAVTFALLLCGCQTMNPPKPNLEDVNWRLVNVGGAAVQFPAGEQEPYLRFDPATKSVRGYSGCNSFQGTYQLTGTALKIGPIASTRRAGPPEQMAIESAFFKALDGVKNVRVKGETLELLDDAATLARFNRAGAP